jgi:hypothetical protein
MRMVVRWVSDAPAVTICRHQLPVLDSQLSGWIERELSHHNVAVHMGTGLASLHVRDNNPGSCLEQGMHRALPRVRHAWYQ